MGDHRWRGYTHPELHTMINAGPGVAASRPIEDGWKALSETLADIDESIKIGLDKLGATWEGSTADAATAALSPLAQWAADAKQGSDVMKTSAQLQGDYIADARKEMPEPVPVTTAAPSTGDKILGFLGGPSGIAHVVQQQQDHERQEAAQDNAEAKAVQVMNTYQSSSEWNSGTLGEFVPPPKVVIDTPPPATAGEYNSSSANYNTPKTWSAPTDNSGTTNTSWAPPPTGPTVSPVYTPPGNGGGVTNPVWAPPAPTPGPPVTPLPPPVGGPNPTPTPPPVWQPPTPGPNPTPPPGTGPKPPPVGGPGLKPGPAPTPGGPRPLQPSLRPMGPGGGPNPFGPNGQGGLRGGPGGFPGGPGGFAGQGGPGQQLGRGGMAGAGAFGMNAPGAGGPGGASGGRGGAAGAGGMAGGGHGGNGDEDIEHKSADYLVETTDVFGDDRLVAPPVIGEQQ
ncbi:hypothetical protein GCM10022243_51580 [Saccharothrix violaceirubra]|uniref:PPE domain-containing protein n=1 Tax=Saccharothrix violaceirubra TaxID=413306 RepID=A0A7W7X053_9PSEU|nr:PPE domain-containing protein [Saccharothrix violaceirubra]MBB4969541.1 hypothetical protein [Saccharothrix violaceirubra]